jgi:hypothetical protein
VVALRPSSNKVECPVIINKDFNLFQFLNKKSYMVWMVDTFCITCNNEDSPIGVNGLIVSVKHWVAPSNM